MAKGNTKCWQLTIAGHLAIHYTPDVNCEFFIFFLFEENVSSDVLEQHFSTGEIHRFLVWWTRHCSVDRWKDGGDTEERKTTWHIFAICLLVSRVFLSVIAWSIEVHLSLQNCYFIGRFSSFCTDQWVAYMGWQKSFLSLKYPKSKNVYLLLIWMKQKNSELKNAIALPVLHTNIGISSIWQKESQSATSHSVWLRPETSLASHTLVYHASGNSRVSFLSIVGAAVLELPVPVGAGP